MRAGKGKAAGAGLLTRGGPSGEKAGSARGGNKLGLGLLLGRDLGLAGLGFFSISISFVFLTQTTQLFEFKNKFEFNPITQTNKRDAPA